jgi:hypothetical protein
MESALWLTGVVRTMADARNHAFTWNSLYKKTAERASVLCSDYGEMWISLAAELNLGTESRILDVGFNKRGYDSHTLVEIKNREDGTWVILDPTFALAVKRASDGGWASAEDIANATLANDYSALTYVFLTDRDDRDARGYYLDYPLLYLNIFHQGQAAIQNSTPLPYLQEVAAPAGTYGVYLVQCDGKSSITLMVDGVVTDISCGGLDSLSQSFFARSIAAPAGSTDTFKVYQPRRFVF